MKKLFQLFFRLDREERYSPFLRLLTLISSFAALAQAPSTFVHPGAVNSQEDLNYVKSKIAANEQPWIGKFNQMVALATATTNTTAPTDENGQKADARKAYANALAWYYTGNTTYAQNAIGVLNMWANTFAGYTPTTGQNQLVGGWIGALLGPAAEIMRGYSGWSSTDIANVQSMFKTKFYPVLNTMSTWNGNVDLTQIDAMMNISVFCEDATEFNLAIQRLNTRNPAYFYLSTDNAASRNIAGDGNNTNTFWSNPSNWINGLTQETCRDNGHHAQYALASALHAAEVAWNQGVDLYTPNEARYTAALELMALQLQTGLMQGTCANNTTTLDLYATWEVGYNHYHNRKGVSLPNTLQLLTSKVRVNSQSDWNIFFETLTHNLDGFTATCGTPTPTVAASIQYEVGESTAALSAVGSNLLWYTSLNGVGSTSAPIPSSSAEGSTTYYVTQTINNCESSKTSITVSVVSLFHIPKTLTAPTVDGIIDNVWASATTDKSVGKTILGTVGNASDLSGTFKALWDDTYLYILGDVNDDSKINDSPEAYFDDAIEVYLDINNNKASTYAANDVLYTFGWNDGTTIVTTPAARSVANISYSMVGKSGGYIFEARIPWTTLQGSPAVGQLVGFDFHVNDDDDGGQRDGKMSWNASADDAWQNPSFFGTAKLDDASITLGLENDLSDESTSANKRTPVAYPNPSSSEFNIYCPVFSKVKVVDNLGRIIDTFESTGDKKIGLDYPNGVYQVLILSPEGNVTNLTLMKGL